MGVIKPWKGCTMAEMKIHKNYNMIIGCYAAG